LSRNLCGGRQSHDPLGFAWSDPQWILCGFGATYNITEVELLGVGLRDAFSNSGLLKCATWTPIYSTTTGPGGVQDLTGLSGAGRYVRMYGTQRADNLWLFPLGISNLWNSCANQSAARAGGDSQPIHSGRQDAAGHQFSQRSNIPPLPLTFSLLTAPTNAAINSAVVCSPGGRPLRNRPPRRLLLWSSRTTLCRPHCHARLHDNSDSASRSCSHAVSITNGQFGFWINGNTGPDYIIQVPPT